jgi:hypothetical protein
MPVVAWQIEGACQNRPACPGHQIEPDDVYAIQCPDGSFRFPKASAATARTMFSPVSENGVQCADRDDAGAGPARREDDTAPRRKHNRSLASGKSGADRDRSGARDQASIETPQAGYHRHKIPPERHNLPEP